MADQKAELLKLKEIKQRSLKSVKWSSAAEICSRGFQPVVMLMLARLLSPSDFGIIAVAISVVSFAQIIQDFGIGKAIIQTEKNVELYTNNAFWVNAGMGIVLYVVLYFAAPPLSIFFKSPESMDVLRVLCLQIVIVSFFSVHSALLKRNLRFKGIFFVRFATSVIPGITSVAMAFWGMGVWSLVYGSLAGSTVQLILYWRLSEWRPKLNFDTIVFIDMFKFSRWVMLEGLLTWIILWGDSIIIGHYLGIKDLGMYRLGSTVIIFASNIFFTPVVNVALSFFSRLQSNLPDLVDCFKKLTQIIISLSIPIGIGLALLAKPIVTVFLGEKWIGTDIVISIMAIRFGIGWFFGLNSTVYTALGRPDLNIKVMIIITIIAIPAYIFGAKYGLLAFCIARLTVSLIDNFINYFVAKNLLDLPLTYIRIILFPLFACIFMAGVICSLMIVIEIHSWIILALVVVAGAISYIVCLYIINKDFVIWGYRYALKIF